MSEQGPRADEPAGGPAENPPGPLLGPGELWPRVRAVTGRALASGDLESIPTESSTLVDAGVAFLIRAVPSLARKDLASQAGQRLAAAGRRDRNPFLPYDPALYVGDLTASHAGVLNKFNVVEHHLLIVPRAFFHQETWLDRADFEAAWVCLREVDGLVFYNGGRAAGASQAHKHLQVVPLPLAGSGPDLPVQPWLDSAVFDGGVGCCPQLPFVHALARVGDLLGLPPAQAAEQGLDRFGRLLSATGLGPWSPGGRQSGAYNLLLTRGHMLVVPRGSEFVEGVSINALGYAGSLLVRRAEQVGLLERLGPRYVLARAGVAAVPS